MRARPLWYTNACVHHCVHAAQCAHCAARACNACTFVLGEFRAGAVHSASHDCTCGRTDGPLQLCSWATGVCVWPLQICKVLKQEVASSTCVHERDTMTRCTHIALQGWHCAHGGLVRTQDVMASAHVHAQGPPRHKLLIGGLKLRACGCDTC